VNSRLKVYEAAICFEYIPHHFIDSHGALFESGRHKHGHPLIIHKLDPHSAQFTRLEHEHRHTSGDELVLVYNNQFAWIEYNRDFAVVDEFVRSSFQFEWGEYERFA
jgi:hypothetical protein